MDKNRIEAFSDGVIAVIITIIVLEMKVPHGPEFASLLPLVPVFLTYVLSFVYVGGIATAWALSAWAGLVFFVIVALMWLVPDRRIERMISKHPT